MSMFQLQPLVLVALLCAQVSVPADAVTLGGNAAVTSDYVWRGTSQTQGDPAVQAGFRLSTDGGWYAALWGSGVEFAPETHASSELDAVIGWSGQLAGDWALDLNLTHYRYPSTTIDLNWAEANAMLTWRGNYWLQAAHSNDALASGGAGTYLQLGARWPLDDALRIEAAVGSYDLAAYGDRYAHGSLSAIWTLRPPFELRISAHATDASAECLFPDLAGSRLEAAVQATF
jgi:uncharacterized protein (TIGR02001 family)